MLVINIGRLTDKKILSTAPFIWLEPFARKTDGSDFADVQWLFS